MPSTMNTPNLSLVSMCHLAIIDDFIIRICNSLELRLGFAWPKSTKLIFYTPEALINWDTTYNVADLSKQTFLVSKRPGMSPRLFS